MTSHVFPPMAAAEPDVEHVLAVRGTGGYRQYRIPALAVSRQGTLLAAYDGRPNLDDLPNPIDLLLRRSTDNGRTWGEQHVVRTGGGLNGYGDPSLLLDVETGRIFMFHSAGTHAGFFEAAAGLEPDDNVQHCDLSYSDDDGLTWQHRRITSQLKLRRPVHPDEPAITGIFAAAGQGIQIHSGPHCGRLVQQFVVLAGGEIMAASAYSDDHGSTWTFGELVGARTHGHAPNENKVAALQDGRLLLHSRGTPRRLAAISDDGGATWSALRPVEDLPDPGDNGSLVRFDGLPSLTSFADEATDSWLPATNNQDTALRRDTVIGTREAQYLNYGPIIPGYKAGDILAFTGRARNDGSVPVTAVRLSGPGSDAFPAADLGQSPVRKRMMYAIGVVLGGTKTAAGLFPRRGGLVFGDDSYAEPGWRRRDPGRYGGAGLGMGAAAAGQAVGGLANILDPEVVVVSGGLSDAGAPPWWRPMERALRAELLPALFGLPVLPAKLGNAAAMVGAARLVLTASS